jgi:hypothetical protein
LLAAEHPRQLQALHASVGFDDRGSRFAARALVVRFLGQLPERDGVVDLASLPLELADRELEPALLFRERLRLFLVVPEAGLDALALDQLNALPLAIDVKAPPGAR